MNYANPDLAPHFSSLALQPLPPHSLSSTQPQHLPPSVLTHFGDAVDVRKRGALRIMQLAGSQHGRALATPAVVRLWHEEKCQELTASQARALAHQLLSAAALVDSQN